MEQAALVDPGDRAAAGTDALDIDGRQAGHVAAKAAAEPGLPRVRDAALADQANIVGRAAGVADDQRVRLVRSRIGERPDRRHARTGIDQLHRRLGDAGGVHDAASRGDDHHPAAEARVPQPAFEAGHVGGHDRLQRCVERRRHGPPIFADRRIDAVREREGDAGQVRLDQPAHRQLVRGVDDRPQEADRNRLDIEGGQTLQDHAWRRPRRGQA